MNTTPSPQPCTWLVTGAAGFIGMHTCQRLLERGDAVIGIDNLNDYYDVDAQAGAPGAPAAASALQLPPARRGRPGRHGRLFARTRPSASSTWRRRPACAIR